MTSSLAGNPSSEPVQGVFSVLAGNLPLEASDDEFQKFIGSVCSGATSVKLIVGGTRAGVRLNKGFGTVHFATSTDAEALVAKTGQASLLGKPVTFRLASAPMATVTNEKKVPPPSTSREPHLPLCHSHTIHRCVVATPLPLTASMQDKVALLLDAGTLTDQLAATGVEWAFYCASSPAAAEELVKSDPANFKNVFPPVLKRPRDELSPMSASQVFEALAKALAESSGKGAKRLVRDEEGNVALLCRSGYI